MNTTHTLAVVTRGYERSALVKRGNTIVAEVFTDTEPGDQYKTAALIAAAPDLLAALQMLCNGATRPVGVDSCGQQMVGLRQAAIEKARAAIAKAGG